MKTFLKRFGRNVAGFAIGFGVEAANQYLGLIPVPLPFQPLVPLVIGPALNAAAKAGRNLLDEGAIKQVCKVL